ncbi:MAG TPA: FAD-dependent oxidoreductase [Candidatus Acidoferrales bacterium]|nr:FAD-dependent oxidoreductase [Candidatus Acidoferrales bacterium]
MKLGRREFMKYLAVAGGAVRSGAGDLLLERGAAQMEMGKTYDVAVIGAGVFGSWTAYHLARAGRKVALIDAYGPGNSRASSGGESRIIRMGYGPDEIYTRWAMRSLALWQEFFAQAGKPLFHPTGVLWMVGADERYAQATLATLSKLGVRFERLERAALEKRFPQFSLEGVRWALLEPESGALMARRAVAMVVEEASRAGVDYLPGAVVTRGGKGKLRAVTTKDGDGARAESFVFACGPWLGKVFPELLGERIFPTRQEVFFFGVPAGDRRFRMPAMPAWIFAADEMYGIPDLENRGMKIALDRHGSRFDPDAGLRVVSTEGLEAMRKYVGRRFPALKDAPVVETRVCQYENTSSGDLLIDRHPHFENVWLVGGGSGHGFKHGPALGEYVAARITAGGAVEQRFSLATKQKVQKRAVY